MQQRHILRHHISEAAQLACQGQGLDASGVDPQYVDSITQAIKGLKEGSDNLTPSIPPEGMANMFAGLQLSEVNTRLRLISNKYIWY